MTSLTEVLTMPTSTIGLIIAEFGDFRLSGWSILPALLPTLLLILSIALWFAYHSNSTDPSIKLPLPPGSMGLPFIGETPMMALRGNSFFNDRLEKYGEVYKTHILGSPVIRVIGAENVKKILLNEHSLVTAYWPRSVRILLGEGSVSNAVGELHTKRRRALQRGFTRDALTNYAFGMDKIIRRHISSWCSQDSVLAYEESKHMAFAMACEVLLGFKMSPRELQSTVEVFTVFGDNLFCLPFKFPGFGFCKALSAREALLKKIEESLIKKRKELSGPNSSASDVQDLLSRLLQAEAEEDSLSMEDMKELGLELLFAGHATTASAVTSILIELAQNRDVLVKLQEELDEHGLWRGEDGDLNLNILNKLPYTAAVVSEALRLSPPVGAAFRTVLKSFSLNGYQIPAGWTVCYSIRETQLTSDVFPNSTKFDPERWLSCDQQKAKYHYLPFGGGSRACVGKEFAKIFLKIFVVEIARLCTWELVGGALKINPFPVPHPTDGLPVRFTELAPGSNRLRSNTL